MPTPDNKREYGSETQGSQRTVAPRGQKAANISSISGGAAAAQPVLQIGQQGQIQQTGAELYQALSGAFNGVAQGIQNYQKMYDMVSQRDYANFESEYYAEQERVHGDPKLMQDWMESSRYEPNRVTAGSYQRLRAGVYQRDYEAQQEDDILSMQQAMVDKPLHEQISYLGSKIDSYEPDSPAHKWIEQTQLKAGTTAAAQSRAVTIGSQTLEAKNKNIELAGQILASDRNAYGDVITTPRFRLALQAKSLGLADIKQNEQGQWVFEMFGEGDQQYDLSALPADLDESLAEGIGQAGINQGNDYVEGMLKASILPASVFNAGGGAKKQGQVDILNAYNALPGGGGADLIRSSKNPLATAGGVAQMIDGDPDMLPAQKREYLTNILSTFEQGSMSEASWEQIESTLPDGVMDKRASAEKMLKDVKHRINGAIHKATNQQYNNSIVDFATALGGATNPDEARQITTEHAMKMGVLPENSDARALGMTMGANGVPLPVSVPLDRIPLGFIHVGFSRPMFDGSGELPTTGDVRFTKSDRFIEETLSGGVRYLNEDQRELASKTMQAASDWSAFEQAASNPNVQIGDDQLTRLAGLPGAHVNVQTATGTAKISPLDYILNPKTATANLSGTATALSGQALETVASTVSALAEVNPNSDEHKKLMFKLQRISDVYSDGNYGPKTSDPTQQEMLSQGFLVAKIATKTGQPFEEAFQNRANYSSSIVTKAVNEAMNPLTENPKRDGTYTNLYGSSYAEDMAAAEGSPEKMQALYWKNAQENKLKSNPWLSVSSANGTFGGDLFNYNSHAVPFDPANTYSPKGRPNSLIGDVVQTLMDTPGWVPDGQDPKEYIRLQVNKATGSNLTSDEFNAGWDDLTNPAVDGGIRGGTANAIAEFVETNFKVGKSSTPPNKRVNEDNEEIRDVAYPITLKTDGELYSLFPNGLNISLRREISAVGVPLADRKTGHEVQGALLNSRYYDAIAKESGRLVDDLSEDAGKAVRGLTLTNVPGEKEVMDFMGDVVEGTGKHIMSPIAGAVIPTVVGAATEVAGGVQSVGEAIGDSGINLMSGVYDSVASRIYQTFKFFYR